jgi:hypothetical protein
VVDDDTIHFINRYRREVAEGASTDRAIEMATAHEGRASLTTAIINSCGFGVLLLSEYKPTAWFGGLLALTMAVAFLAEVFILPAIIKLLPRYFGADALRRIAAPAAAAAVLLSVLAAPATAGAQALARPTGHVSAFADWFPNRADTRELRGRLFVEEKITPSAKVTITTSGFIEGLLRDSSGAELQRHRTAVLRLHEAAIQFRTGRADLYAGFGRVVWGRLDELQPTDVINPLDVSRFFFEGRSEARLAVPVVRGRLYFSDDVSLEGVYVPVFRRGRFDQLDEASSPFNIVAAPSLDVITCLGTGCPALPPPLIREEPGVRAGNAQGGVRFNATSGRTDWSLSTYTGLEPFGLFSTRVDFVAVGASPMINIVERFPRFTMVGGDFETVAGRWAFRGEVAAFVRDTFQGVSTGGPAQNTVPQPSAVSGSSLDAGFGIERKAGNYRITGTLLLHHESANEPVNAGPLYDPRRDVSLLVSSERTFAQERYRVRAFSVYNPSEESFFARGIAAATVRDDVAVEGSVGWFGGDGRDTIGRFSDSDFVYLRLKYYF